MEATAQATKEESLHIVSLNSVWGATGHVIFKVDDNTSPGRKFSLVLHSGFGGSVFGDLVKCHPLGLFSLDGVIYWIPYGG